MDVGAQSDEALSVELVEGERFFALEAMAGGHHQNQLFLPAGHGPQTRPGFWVGHQTEIGAPVPDGFVDFLRLAVIDSHLHAGVVLPEFLEQGGQVVQRDADDAGDAEFPSEFPAGHAEA